MLDYARAVKICTDHFRSALSAEGANGMTILVNKKTREPVVFSVEEPPSESDIRSSPHVWVEAAKCNHEVHEVLFIASKAMRENKLNLPRPIEEWLISLALEEEHPPATPKRKFTGTIDGLIFHTVAALVIQSGYRPTRNEELGPASGLGEKRSACDAVADAFANLRHETGIQLPSSYDRVRKRWQAMKLEHPFDEVEYRSFADVHPSGVWKLVHENIECSQN